MGTSDPPNIIDRGRKAKEATAPGGLLASTLIRINQYYAILLDSLPVSIDSAMNPCMVKGSPFRIVGSCPCGSSESESIHQ
jgi:hypothetical protein